MKQGEAPPPVVGGFNEMEALAELNEERKQRVNAFFVLLHKVMSLKVTILGCFLGEKCCLGV